MERGGVHDRVGDAAEDLGSVAYLSLGETSQDGS